MRHLLPILLGIFFAPGCASRPPMQTVEQVDLARYAGTWYEVARFPHSFEKGMTNVSATYVVQDDGTVKVINAASKENGSKTSITGKAWRPDPAFAGRLKVRFFWPFYGSYWIIGLDPDYRWAVVGHPSRSYLWFLTREKSPPPETWKTLESIALGQGYDLTPLIRVKQE
jgi:apolipoprotein D and lipocalin family protein